MPKENVDVVRSIYASWAEGDFRGPMEHFDPHVVFVLHPGFTEAGAYYGMEQISDYTRALLGAWERFTVEGDEITELDDAVFASVLQRGVGRSSGTVTELRYFHLWALQGGKVIRYEAFRERAEALNAAGADPRI